MYQFSEREKFLCSQIVDAAFKVHSALGPGLLEKVYETCFCYELTKRNIAFERQILVPIFYDGIYFNEALRLDVFVENTIVCELKAQETVNPVWVAQVFSHLKLTNKHVGFLINFNVPKIKQGIQRLYS